MSEIYTLEPPNRGRVILTTTLGPIEVDLWAKECPKACRNFVQLCLEGYYDDTTFHRVIPGFLVQGGDPSGAGTGGESVYGPSSFPNEYHSRLKFRYRGLVGVATQYPECKYVPRSAEFDPLGQEPEFQVGRPVNGSQFFITLDRADGLNGKHTLFGKVTGPTIWNLARIGELETDSNDRPLECCRIVSCDVVWNPFEDIVPRQLPSRLIANETAEPTSEVSPATLRPNLTKKHAALLSFETEEPDSAEEKVVRSAHDLLETQSLLPATSSPEPAKQAVLQGVSQAESLSIDKIAALKSKVADITARNEPKIESQYESESVPNEQQVSVQDQIAQEYATQARDRVSVKSQGGLGTSTKLERELLLVQDADLMTEHERRREFIRTRKASKTRREKEGNILKHLQDFEKRLKSLNVVAQSDNTESNAMVEEEEEDNGLSWANTKGLRFAIDSSTAFAFDASQQEQQNRLKHHGFKT
eukprot:Gregarina_sp_Poly_1__4963@NODE_262_length_10455_cov_153_948017_g229_i0_p3_GENE_NODE_262_length_10455_cov_153_948017_g229_i0NODE_262_length_10455_cov_153_948017_g229_i0_p3_ORF_typecomplete_len474_score76_06Pro_isomerase/PF00160_21/3_3e42MNNL/PF07657_13/0_078_NODE_262_length_10455_cov_153_948017_g229_i0131434